MRRMKLRVKCAVTAKQLREARDHRLLTQQEAALQVGVAYRTWQNWESGRVTPRVKHQRALLAWLNGQAEQA